MTNLAHINRVRRSRNRRRQARQPVPQWGNNEDNNPHCLTCHQNHSDNPWDCHTFPGLYISTCRHCSGDWDHNFDPSLINPWLSLVDNCYLNLANPVVCPTLRFLQDLEYKSYLLRKLVDLVSLAFLLLLFRFL